jgi:hypothetical protein
MAPRIAKGDRFDYGDDPLEGHSVDTVIHLALGRAKDTAEQGDLAESQTWSAIAQAAATFHLSISLQQSSVGGHQIHPFDQH